MRFILQCALVMLSLSLMSCASLGLSSDKESPLSRDFLSHQQKCSEAWGELVAEWRAAGGGTKTSIALTRQQIASDTTSKLADAIRRVWLRQDANGTDSLGHWPVDGEEELELGLLLSQEIARVAPAECNSPAWLQPYLWDDMHAIEGGELIEHRLKEAPESMIWDSYIAPRWLMYWLLIRL